MKYEYNIKQSHRKRDTMIKNKDYYIYKVFATGLFNILVDSTLTEKREGMISNQKVIVIPYTTTIY